MSEEEKKYINIFIEKVNKYDESVEIKGVPVTEEMRILDTVVKCLNKVENQQKEIEELEAYKKWAEEKISIGLANIEIDKLNKEIKGLRDNDYIPKSKIKEKIKEYDGLKIIDKSAWEEQVKPLIELLEEVK